MCILARISLSILSCFCHAAQAIDMSMFAKSQSLLIISLSDTDVIQDYMDKVKFINILHYFMQYYIKRCMIS